ncbi:hypothetical protein OU790_19835, partial [Ruegeria sp. NA]
MSYVSTLNDFGMMARRGELISCKVVKLMNLAGTGGRGASPGDNRKALDNFIYDAQRESFNNYLNAIHDLDPELLD